MQSDSNHHWNPILSPLLKILHFSLFRTATFSQCWCDLVLLGEKIQVYESESNIWTMTHISLLFSLTQAPWKMPPRTNFLLHLQRWKTPANTMKLASSFQNAITAFITRAPFWATGVKSTRQNGHPRPCLPFRKWLANHRGLIRSAPHCRRVYFYLWSVRLLP